MLVHETLASRPANIYIIGAGLAALGLPPAFRLDEFRRKNGNGNGNGEKKP